MIIKHILLWGCWKCFWWRAQTSRKSVHMWDQPGTSNRNQREKSSNDKRFCILLRTQPVKSGVTWSILGTLRKILVAVFWMSKASSQTVILVGKKRSELHIQGKIIQWTHKRQKRTSEHTRDIVASTVTESEAY